MVAPKAEAPASAMKGAMVMPKLPSVTMMTTPIRMIFTTLPMNRDSVMSICRASHSAATFLPQKPATLRPMSRTTRAPSIWKPYCTAKAMTVSSNAVTVSRFSSTM